MLNVFQIIIMEQYKLANNSLYVTIILKWNTIGKRKRKSILGDEKMATVEQLANEERRAYFRKWRAENKDKVKRHNATYWKKRALKKLEERAQGTDKGV